MSLYTDVVTVLASKIYARRRCYNISSMHATRRLGVFFFWLHGASDSSLPQGATRKSRDLHVAHRDSLVQTIR